MVHSCALSHRNTHTYTHALAHIHTHHIHGCSHTHKIEKQRRKTQGSEDPLRTHMLLVSKVLLHKAHSISWEGHTGTSNIHYPMSAKPTAYVRNLCRYWEADWAGKVQILGPRFQIKFEQYGGPLVILWRESQVISGAR